MIVRSRTVAARGSETRGKDRQQFITLAQHRIDRLDGQESHSLDEFEPRASFAKLFETDAELVNEVATRLGGLNLTVIREGRRAAASQLQRRVLPEECSGQPIPQPARDGSETYQSVL